MKIYKLMGRWKSRGFAPKQYEHSSSALSSGEDSLEFQARLSFQTFGFLNYPSARKNVVKLLTNEKEEKIYWSD